MINVGFIGCGNMGGALALSASKSSEASVFLYDKDAEKASLLSKEISAVAATLNEAASKELVFLGVKPNIIASVAEEIKDTVRKSGAAVVSMAAGVSIQKIEEILGFDVPIIRIMPNTPVSVGKGIILYTCNKAAEKHIDKFLTVMANAGSLDAIDERLIDAASAISGCGPAFAYMFFEALADGGVMCGLPRERAMRYAAEMLVGAGEVVLKTGAHPGELKDAVCSPGGSTIEGVKALEDGSMRGVVAGAVNAAYEKTLKLGK